MPYGWVHATVDLISFGRPHFDLHQLKDRPHKYLGKEHRSINHAWYQEYDIQWNFADPFPSWLLESFQELLHIESPDKVEEQMVDIAHDHLDKIWDDLLPLKRKYWESFFAWVVINPLVLKSWAGVDVLNSRIQRIVDGQEIWEYCPDLKFKYRRLRCYINAMIRNNKGLQIMLRHHG